jgi:hypothetical protein
VHLKTATSHVRLVHEAVRIKFSYLSSGEAAQEGLSLGLSHLEGGRDINLDASILGSHQGLEGTGVSGVGVESLSCKRPIKQ